MRFPSEGNCFVEGHFSQLASQPASKRLASQPGSQQASQPAASQPASSKPASQPTSSQPASQKPILSVFCDKETLPQSPDSWKNKCCVRTLASVHNKPAIDAFTMPNYCTTIQSTMSQLAIPLQQLSLTRKIGIGVEGVLRLHFWRPLIQLLIPEGLYIWYYRFLHEWVSESSFQTVETITLMFSGVDEVFHPPIVRSNTICSSKLAPSPAAAPSYVSSILETRMIKQK